MLPVRIVLFLVINLFNFGIFEVALTYLKPDFTSGFLLHKTHLSGSDLFKNGLIIHGIAACTTLFLCSLLVLFRFENTFRKLHKVLGKLALILLFLCVIPGGFILSFYAEGGVAGKFLFFLLSAYTAYCGGMAYRLIRQKNVFFHSLFMKELLWLLCSAIILRVSLITLSLTSSFEWKHIYCFSIFISWLPTIIIFALLKRKRRYNHFP